VPSFTSLRVVPGGLTPRAPLSLMAGAAFPRDRAGAERFRALVDEHFNFVWRSLRRLGLPAADLDDAAQEVFVVAARRLADFPPDRERAFLFGTAARVVSTRRRGARRHPEDADDALDERPAQALDPEAMSQLLQARPLLQQILDAMNPDVRAVFTLAELEEMSSREIAELLEIPIGTVSSRLRVARETFHAAVKRLAAREAFSRRPR
jgi:RNA polymerase sigma-70 factor, ECF subfamily